MKRSAFTVTITILSSNNVAPAAAVRREIEEYLHAGSLAIVILRDNKATKADIKLAAPFIGLNHCFSGTGLFTGLCAPGFGPAYLEDLGESCQCSNVARKLSG